MTWEECGFVHNAKPGSQQDQYIELSRLFTSYVEGLLLGLPQIA
jgi:hypothetical protein